MTAYDDNNIFAKILRGELPCEKVYEDDHVLAFMDIMPRADGHVLVIPKAKARNILDIAPNDLKNLIAGAQTVAKAVKAGGQIVFHIHFHILPRWDGVALRPHTGAMAPAEDLKKFAAQIRAAF